MSKPSMPSIVAMYRIVVLCACSAAASVVAADTQALPRPAVGEQVIRVDPEPRFELSPYLYMQFMEPLGTTDGSVEAAWDQMADRWRPDVVDATKELAPTMMRWGGCFSSYYRWREGVGPRDERVPMYNLLWGGIESNQIGTQEFVDFSRRVGAEPLLCVNFESDGRLHWANPPKGGIRSANADEAAAWVDYCNNPDNPLRKAHGVPHPYNVRFWQIGNETSYDRRGFDVKTAAEKTVLFAQAMRKVDPTIKLIGWGDSGWAGTMLDVAGAELDYLAFHHMFNPGPPLAGVEYRRDPTATWDALMNVYRLHEDKICQIRKSVAGTGMPLALTECHLALSGRNRCEVLSSWAAGVANARMLNVHQRHGDVLKIATLADFCGTRWQVNAVIIPTPRGKSFLMPVASVMRLYRKHSGHQALEVVEAAPGLDVVASRTGSRVFLQVVNTNRTDPVMATLAIDGQTIAEGVVYELAAPPEREVLSYKDAITPQRRDLPANRTLTFPPASVSAVEIELAGF